MFLIVPGKRKQKMILRLAQLNRFQFCCSRNHVTISVNSVPASPSQKIWPPIWHFSAPHSAPFWNPPIPHSVYYIQFGEIFMKVEEKTKKNVFQLNTKFLSKTMSLSCPTKMPNLASLCLKTLAGTLVNINCCKWLCCTDVQLLKMINILINTLGVLQFRS